VIEVAQGGDKKPMPPLLLVKSDGGLLYGTTDMATIIERVEEQNPDLVLYWWITANMGTSSKSSAPPPRPVLPATRISSMSAMAP